MNSLYTSSVMLFLTLSWFIQINNLCCMLLCKASSITGGHISSLMLSDRCVQRGCVQDEVLDVGLTEKARGCSCPSQSDDRSLILWILTYGSAQQVKHLLLFTKLANITDILHSTVSLFNKLWGMLASKTGQIIFNIWSLS